MDDEYDRARRSRTNLRLKYLLVSTELLLNEKNLQELKEANLSLAGRLQTDHTFFIIAHSFGEATVLTAAKRRPDMIKAVIAHDPAIGRSSIYMQQPTLLDSTIWCRHKIVAQRIGQRCVIASVWKIFRCGPAWSISDFLGRGPIACSSYSLESGCR